jgi:hypothetical protein
LSGVRLPGYVACQEAGGRPCAVRAPRQDPAPPQMRAAPDPRALAREVWGLTSRPAVPSAGFPPASRLPARFSPFARLPLVPLVRRAPARSLRPLPGSGSPSVPSGFPFPWAISTLAPPRSDSAGVGPGRQGPRSSVLPRPLAGSRDPPAPQESSGWPPWDAATGSPTCVDSGGSGAFGEATQSGSSRASCSSQGNDAA